MASLEELEPVRPLPDPTAETRGYWEAAKNHQLALQRCLECKAFRHHPRPMCPHCFSLESEWAPVSGRGTVYSFALVNQLLHPYWTDAVPYNVVLVELEEGIRIISNLVDCPNESIEIGMPVTVVFQDISSEITLPLFKPVSS